MLGEYSSIGKLTGELLRLRGDNKASKSKKVMGSLTLSHFVTLLFRMYLLGGITNNFEMIGGPHQFLAYIVALVLRGSAERVFTVVMRGSLLRSHIHRKCSCGQIFFF